ESDFLCCLVEGTTYRRRTKYADSNESFFRAKRPVMVNGINCVAVRGDLLDRAVLLDIVLPKKRRSEQELEADFESKRPLILGALYDAISAALRSYEAVVVEDPKP